MPRSIRRADSELAVVAEAESLAAEIEASDVQQRTYQEAHVTLKVVDGRDAPLAELIGSPAAQTALANALTMFLGCGRDDRLYVSSARRIEYQMNGSMGVTYEPATEVVVNVKREVGTGRTARAPTRPPGRRGPSPPPQPASTALHRPLNSTQLNSTQFGPCTGPHRPL